MAPVRKKCTGQEPQVQPDIPAFPARMVLRLIRDLPGDRAFLPPSVVGLIEPGNLSASVGAPGPHDFAVRGCLRSSCAHPRPSQPATQRIVTTRTPLCMRRDSSREDTVLGK